MPRPTTFQVAIACGAAGAYVDVSSYLEADEGFDYSWGRQSGFENVAPGEFSFTLNNADGRFTPENAASPLVTKLTEGMGVSWLLESRIVAGTITAIEPEFPSGIAAWSRVHITADDALGDAARTQVDSLPKSMVAAASPYYWWRLEDSEDSSSAEDQSGALTARLTPSGEIVPQFGAEGIAGVSDSSVLFPTGTLASSRLIDRTFPTFAYTGTSLGWVNFWVVPPSDLTSGGVNMIVNHAAGGDSANFGVSSNNAITGTSGIWTLTTSNVIGATSTGVPVNAGVPTHISLGGDLSGSTLTVTLYVNGVLAGTRVASAVGAYLPQLTSIDFGSGFVTGGTGPTESRFANVSHTPNRVDEYTAVYGNAAQRLTTIAAAVPTVTLDTLPTDLSPAPLGAQRAGSALDLINEVIFGEQGQVYATTTGTLTAPVSKVTVRSRVRPTAVSATFALETDTNDVPEIKRDVTNLVSTVTVDGANDLSATITDATLVQRAKSASTSERVVFSALTDIQTFGQDRLLRGANTQLQVYKITVDARGSSTNRYTDLLAMIPGNRYQISGLPTTQLGIATIDGWFLGAQEYHSTAEDTFDLYFEPVLPPTGIFDTDDFTAGGELTLTAAITNVATSMTVATTGSRASTTDVPYNLLLDSEIVTVTAMSGATPQVATIVRGQAGTTAAAHVLGTAPELAPPTLFAY